MGTSFARNSSGVKVELNRPFGGPASSFDPVPMQAQTKETDNFHPSKRLSRAKAHDDSSQLLSHFLFGYLTSSRGPSLLRLGGSPTSATVPPLSGAPSSRRSIVDKVTIFAAAKTRYSELTHAVRPQTISERRRRSHLRLLRRELHLATASQRRHCSIAARRPQSSQFRSLGYA